MRNSGNVFIEYTLFRSQNKPNAMTQEFFKSKDFSRKCEVMLTVAATLRDGPHIKKDGTDIVGKTNEGLTRHMTREQRLSDLVGQIVEDVCGGDGDEGTGREEVGET